MGQCGAIAEKLWGVQGNSPRQDTSVDAVAARELSFDKERQSIAILVFASDDGVSKVAV